MMVLVLVLTVVAGGGVGVGGVVWRSYATVFFYHISLIFSVAKK